MNNSTTIQDNVDIDLAQSVARRFVCALEGIINYQKKHQIGSYPFVVEHSPFLNHFLVHLGPEDIVKAENIDRIEQEYIWQGQTAEQNPFEKKRQYTVLKPRQRRKKLEQTENGPLGKDLKSTKNIPKNYAKAIMNFATKNLEVLQRLIPDPADQQLFVAYLNQTKFKIQNIKQFSYMLQDKGTEQQKAWNKIFRILRSHIFVRNHAVAYIFHSRIIQDTWHIKYRNDILKALRIPDQFKKVKIK